MIDKLPIVEMYPCVQGEGKMAGIPHFLIRFKGCNLRCQFRDSICDTPFASWNIDNVSAVSLEQVKNMFEKNEQIKHIFITGGEPCMHEKSLRKVLQLSKEYDLFTAIETNGTRFIDNLVLDLVTISPKMSNSSPKVGSIVELNDERIVVNETMRDLHDSMRQNLKSMKNWLLSYDNIQWKFVISTDDDLKEVRKFLKKMKIENKDVYLMPEGINSSQLAQKRQWLIEMCIKEGMNYTDRLHIIAYGNQRGV